MRVALHNIHLLPTLKFHSYVFEILKNKLVSVLYFSDPTCFSYITTLTRLALHESLRENYKGIEWSNFDFVFSSTELNRKADVLINLNLLCPKHLYPEFSNSLSKFNGIKIFHTGDYFWYRPASESNKLLEKIGVDHLFGYSMHDKYCEYFSKSFPKYHQKVWGIPFGFTSRFETSKTFKNRKSKAVAVGSVNPLRPLNEKINNFQESANFFPDESWFHKFRRMLVLNKNILKDEVDSMLPEFPDIKDFKYDLVSKFNDYQMFVSCESIFNFPPAKTFEGMACMSTLICANLKCNTDLGLIDGVNCIMYTQYDLNNFKDKLNYYRFQEDKLREISQNGNLLVSKNYNQKRVAEIILATINEIYTKGIKTEAKPLTEFYLKNH